VAKEGIKDMNNNTIKAIRVDKALQVSTYTDDTRKPEISKVTLDMAKLQLTLSFTETVNAKSLKVETIVLLNAGLSATQSVRLSKASVTSSKDGPIIVIDIAEADANAIKTADKLASTSVKDAYVNVASGTIADVDGNTLVALTTQADVFVADNVPPKLTKFELDMTSLQVTLHFSETVNAATLNIGMLNFQNATGSSEISSHVLKDGTKSSKNVNKVTIAIKKADADALKAKVNLATEKDDTFIVVQQGAIRDMRGNKVNAINATHAQKVSIYNQDGTKPTLLSFTALMPTKKPPVKLEMQFSESISMRSFNFSGVILSDGGGKAYRLTSGIISRHPGSSTVLDVTLSSKDLANIITLEGPLRTAANTQLALDYNTVSDEAQNPIMLMNTALAPTTHTVDVTPPHLVSFDLDFAADSLALVFSEPVTENTFAVTQVTLQANKKRCVSGTCGASLTLSAKSKFALAAGASTKMVIQLEDSDVDKIKADAKFAASEKSTFLSITKHIVQDPALNDALGVDDKAAMQVSKYTPDNVAPKIISYDLDMTTGVISMTFNEVIAVASVDLTHASLRDTESSIVGTLVSPKLSGKASGKDGTVMSKGAITLTFSESVFYSQTLHDDQRFHRQLRPQAFRGHAYASVRNGCEAQAFP